MRVSSLDKVRENVRLQQVYNVFVHYGGDMLFSQNRFLYAVRHDLQRWVWQLPPDLEPPTNPVKMRLMIEELGPTYVKMGQIVSSQASVIPPEWAAELEKLQSDVPPFPGQEARQRIIEELHAPPEELFAAFDPTPFAAASTAQVHRATLHDGAEVAVKVQRPDIYRKMKADIGLMQNATRVASARSELIRSIDLSGMLAEFGNGVLSELDYRNEAYNATQLAANMAMIPGVHVPAIYADLSTSKLLTMEFVRGVKISDVEAIERAGLDREEIALSALRALIKQLPIDGFFHADPHPGNILVDLDTGVLTFIDMGMVGELDFHQRLHLVQLILAVQQRDVEGMASVLRDVSTPLAGVTVDDKAYERDFKRKVGRYLAGSGVPSFGQAANEGFDLLREHGLRLDTDLTLAVKALVQTESIAKTLYPGGGIVAQGVPILEELAFKTYTSERVADELQKQLMSTARQVIKRIPSLSEATMKWVDQYQKGRFQVTIDTSELSKEVNKLSRLGREIVLAIMLVGMVVGSAIATNALESTRHRGGIWSLLSTLTYLAYGLAIVMAFVIVIRLGWRWLRGKTPEGD